MVEKKTKKSSKRKSPSKKTVKKSPSKKTATSKPKKDTPVEKNVTIDTFSLLIFISAIALLLSIVSIIQISSVLKSVDKGTTGLQSVSQVMDKVNENIDIAIKAAIPGKISLISIVDNTCRYCSSIEGILESIRGGHVNVTSESTLDYRSSEAYTLIKKYNIDMIPTVIVTGELNRTQALNKQWADLGTVGEDALVLRKLNPPFRNVTQAAIVGRVSLVSLVDSSCPECPSLEPVVNAYKGLGIAVVNESTVDVSSEDGKSLLKKYNITKIPTIILSSEANEYSNIRSSWARAGTIEADGTLVLRELNPPYKDLTLKKVVGLVNVLYLSDKSCAECYDVSMHKSIVQRFGVSVASEVEYDITDSAGIELIKKYNITKVPTIVLTGDPSAYPALTNVWKSVGNIEGDGAYVFRQVEIMRVKYKDLTTGNVV